MLNLVSKGSRALVLLSVASSISATAAVKMERQGQGRVWTVTVDGVDFANATDIEGTSFTKAVLRGVKGYEGVTSEEGTPELPVVRFWVAGDGDIKVETESDATAVNVPGPTGYLRPSVPSSIKRFGALPVFTLDWKKYLAAVTSTKPAFDVQDVGTVRGVKRRLVTLYPLRYNPTGKTGSLTLSFKITQSALPPKEDSAAAHSEHFAVVVPAKFSKSPALKKYEDFKRSLGYYVDQVDVSESDAKPESIRNELKDLYNYGGKGLRYAVLVGTQADLPGFESGTISGVTDHYYRSLDNDDYSKDVGTPDIGVGRFSAQDEAQLAAIVDKTIAYEKGTFANEDWLKKATFIGSDDPNFWQVAEGTHDYVIDHYMTPRGFTGAFPNANEAGGDKIYAVSYKGTSGDVMKQMAAGRALINYGGHGGADEWVGPTVTREDVKKLNVAGSLPWVIANACDTADFRGGDSIAEAWQRNPNGAVAYLGSMDSTYWDEDDIFERRMYDGLFEKGITRLGDVAEFANAEVWRYYGGKGRSAYYFETYTTLGDPSVQFRTWGTRGVKIWGPASVRTGTASAKYQVVDENNVPLAGARVALNSASYDYHTVATADKQGNVTLPLGKGSRYTVVVSGQNLRVTTLAVRVTEPQDNKKK